MPPFCTISSIITSKVDKVTFEDRLRTHLEPHQLDPSMAHARTGFDGSEIGREFITLKLRAEREVDFLILRPSDLYGLHPSGLAGKHCAPL
jgi:hypothetical protein